MALKIACIQEHICIQELTCFTQTCTSRRNDLRSYWRRLVICFLNRVVIARYAVIEVIKCEVLLVHKYHCALLDGPLSYEDSATYGVNFYSPLNCLDNFHVVTQLPQDIMHILLEGVIPYELSFLLTYFIIIRFRCSHGEVSSPELQENGTLRFMQATVDSCRELHITPPKKRVWVPDYNLAS